MADYGHELAFGTFITPQNQRPQDVVALARLTEQAGLDLATFQDHPYQPGFLDTWTLLSWVAAQTETLRVAANVLNLPLRPPAVLARAAASLDLLSGGRVELGLGAGAFWDGIEAMGGTRLTPGQSVDALSAAIDVIRGIWDVSERGGVRVNGEHHRVAAPSAARSRRTTSRSGWAPTSRACCGSPGARPTGGCHRSCTWSSTSSRRRTAPSTRRRSPPGAIRARCAGCSPSRAPSARSAAARSRARRSSGSRSCWRSSSSAASARSSSPATIPGRSRCSARRSRPRSARRSRGSAHRGTPPDRSAARTPWRSGVTASTTTGCRSRWRPRRSNPGTGCHRKVRSTYIRSGLPGLVLRPENVDDVVAALAFARGQDVPLAVRSGGHGISGRSTNDGGIVIDVGKLDEVEMIDRATARVRLGPGARWGDVAQALAPYGLGRAPATTATSASAGSRPPAASASSSASTA